jgi:hypothetical protein
MYGDYQPKTGDQYKVPEIRAVADEPTAWVEPDPKQPLTFRAVGQAQPMTMVPLYKIIRERYAVYWKVNQKSV